MTYTGNHKIKKIFISLIFLFNYNLSNSQDPDDFFKEQEKQFDNYSKRQDSVFQKHKQEQDRTFEEYSEEQDRIFEEYTEEQEKKWNLITIQKEVYESEPIKNDASNVDSAQKEVYESEPIKNDASNVDSAQKEVYESEPIKNDASNVDSAQKEVYESEPIKNDASNVDSTQKEVYESEPIKNDASNVDSTRILREIVKKQPILPVFSKPNNVPSIYPLKKGIGKKTSNYGYRRHPKSQKRKFHTGVDIAAYSGSEIYATADGIVESAGWTGGYGNYVVIKHSDDYKTAYAHQSKVLVQKGDAIKCGDIIGRVGSTGRSTGPHLHYEVIYKEKKINPEKFY